MPITAIISPTGQPIKLSFTGEYQAIGVSPPKRELEFTGSIIGDSFQQYNLGYTVYRILDGGNGFIGPWYVKWWEYKFVAEDTFESYETGSFTDGMVGGTFQGEAWPSPWKVIQY